MGTHEYHLDPRNDSILIYINGKLIPRTEAKVSVFDSGFLLGDGVWEGIRLHNGHLVFLEEHLNRLYDGAKAMAINIGKSPEELTQAVYQTTEANGMESGVHIRLIVSRGLKSTPYQHPSANVGGPTIVIIPEYKAADETVSEKGIRLGTVSILRGTADSQDPRINSLSKFNCIAACIEADKAGVDEALMLDVHGHVSTCNSTNFFMVKNSQVWTSTGEYCLNGVTRGKIIQLCQENNIPVFQKNFLPQDVH
ncbi:MAG: aminotransferase class IV, partial [Candidatus Marinimicrobia bacterium]|nr:aminotransferase class IV [Candidatus Neomarinimicrobiota bacterium]